jgi:small conductance mechanosensitive channel
MTPGVAVSDTLLPPTLGIGDQIAGMSKPTVSIPTVIRRSLRPVLLILLAIGCSLGVILSDLADAETTPAPVSLPDLSREQISRWLNPPGSADNLDTAVISLDGRRLFLVAAPPVSDTLPPGTAPVEYRERTIESKLRQFVRSEFNPATLQVNYQMQNGLPVIYANDQPLLTVTLEDAELYGVDLQTRAETLSTQLQSALGRAKQEREPDFLKRQGVITLIVLLVVSAASYSTSRLQRSLQRRHQALKTVDPVAPPNPPPPAEAPPPPAEPIHKALKPSSRRQRQKINTLQREGLYVWQFLLWVGGGLVIVGLFPQTRWLQVFLLRGIQLPLQLAVLGLGLYFATRLGTLLIDRLFKPLEKGDFLSPETAQKLLEPEVFQRLALRISTLNQVLKNITVITLSVVGLLVALSLIGVPLGPLIASAGLIGLALSFAAQSVLKDSINGFLIFLEDQYGVGDWITVGDLSGSVEKIGLRITQLRDIEGALITIPNGDIRAVKNLSKNWARVDINVPIAYSANLMKAMALMDTVAWEMHQDTEWQDLILEPPQLMGADDFGDQGVIVKLWIKTLPLEQWKVAREYRRRLKLAFDRAGIPLPLPQQVLWVRPSSLPEETDA